MAAFDAYEREAAECNLPDQHRLARRFLLEKFASALLAICRTQDERIEVFSVFAGFVKRRVAPLLDEVLATRREELENAFTAHFLREGQISELFLDILVRDWSARGWEVCSICGMTYHDHLVLALSARSLEELRQLHHFAATAREGN